MIDADASDRRHRPARPGRALPCPGRRWCSPVVETLAIETTAWMRRPWMPRIPLEIRMAHRLGYEFVHEIRIGRGALSFRFGLDAYVGGHGLMKVGPSLQTGIEFDQGALIALWGEALCFPAAWERRTDIRWEAVDERTARLVVEGPKARSRSRSALIPTTGCPASCTADRYKAKGPKVGWTGRFGDWRRFDGGVLAPGRFEVQWADEPYPWIEIRTTSVSVNAPVDDALRLGRHAFRAVERGRRRRGRPAPATAQARHSRRRRHADRDRATLT